MSEDSPVEGDEQNSEWIEDRRVNDEDNKCRRQPAPGGGCVQPGTKNHVPDAEHHHQYQHQCQHEHSQYSAGETAGSLRLCGASQQL